jgi:hypothetical protein
MGLSFLYFTLDVPLRLGSTPAIFRVAPVLVCKYSSRGRTKSREAGTRPNRVERPPLRCALNTTTYKKKAITNQRNEHYHV